MADNDMQMFAFATECVFRRANGLLIWIGYPENPMAKAVERVNEHKASEADLLALSEFPVFDEATAYADVIEIQ